MCGRYAFDDIDEIYEMRALLEEAAARLGRAAAERAKTGEVFPSEHALVLAQTPRGSRADVMEWGYPMRGSSRRIINARAETLGEKPMFAGSLADRKCLVPCSGFFEWQKTGSASRKFRIRPAGQPFFYMAGLFRDVPGGEGISRFVIVTTEASEQMRQVHNRMPLIVPAKNRDAWLAGGGSVFAGQIGAHSGALDIIAV